MKNKKIFNNQAFSLTEILVVTTLLVAVLGGLFSTMISGQDAWTVADSRADLQRQLRTAQAKMSSEIRQSGSDESGNLKLSIAQSAGYNASDVISFSVPIICEAGGTFLDQSTSAVSNWGAPLTLGCKDSSCMDADNDCATRDYAFISYSLTSSGSLVRKVFNTGGDVVRTDTIAHHITQMDAVLGGAGTVVSVSLTASGSSQRNKNLSLGDSFDIVLRNRR